MADERARAAGLDHGMRLDTWDETSAARVRRVMLTHHKPDRTDDALDELAARFAGGTPGVIVAADGGILDL